MKTFTEDDFKIFINKIISLTPVRRINYVPNEKIQILKYKNSISCTFLVNIPEFVYRFGGVTQICFSFFPNGECYYRDPRYSCSDKGWDFTENWLEFLKSKNVTINDVFENELNIER